VPNIFVYNPAMLLIGTTPLALTQNLTTALVGMTALGAAMIGFFLAPMNWAERVWCGIAGLVLISPGLLTDATGLLMVVVAVFIQMRKKKALEAAAVPVAAA